MTTGSMAETTYPLEQVEQAALLQLQEPQAALTGTVVVWDATRLVRHSVR